MYTQVCFFVLCTCNCTVLVMKNCSPVRHMDCSTEHVCCAPKVSNAFHSEPILVQQFLALADTRMCASHTLCSSASKFDAQTSVQRT